MIASEQPVTGTPTAPREQEGRGSRKEQRGRRSEGCPSRSAQGGGVSGPLVDAPCAYVFGRASAGCAASPSVLETLCRREREREGGRGKGRRKRRRLVHLRRLSLGRSSRPFDYDDNDPVIVFHPDRIAN
ncbi:unnamed protein product [Prorocentrum cordatum]|uniref:Uncharacterized protein n=1 Tax=Prorocentrum cordatum TaxID=2364126 RepID=A0ABN9T7C2_9DINO|nr:unnamed protein product [Polarella glacialis]